MQEETNIETRTVALRALLDGIDACRRVLQPHARLQPLGEEWREQLAQCCDAQRLTAPDTDALLRMAEGLAAGGEAVATPATLAVSPVFDTIKATIKREAAPRRFPLTPLTATPDAYLATRTDSPRPAEIAAHGAALERALEQVRRQVRWHDFECVYSYLLHVLQVFGWCLPAAIETGGANDVSIYNHARSSAAIAACLPAAGDLESADRPIAALVKGDISGTQDFLYQMTSAGAARGLRGRSFYLQLLGETIARWMLREFGLPDANLLFAGGGHFYLLLPAAELKLRWDHPRKSIAEKLWRAHQGDLSLAMGCVELSAADFAGGFAEKWAEVSRVTNEAKQRKWIELGGEAMSQSLFTPRQRGTTAEEMCQVCHGEYDETAGDRENNGVRRCRRCESFEDLGRDLRHASHLVTFSVPDGAPPANARWREILASFGASVHLLDKTSDTPVAPPQSTSARVELLQPGGFADRFRWEGLPTGYGVRLLANATPMKSDDEIADFHDLAAAADGVKWLGVLRMDVDDLGRVFSEGRENLGGRATIARMSALSESLRWFFEGRVARVCRAQNQRGEGGKDRVYLIHAGGDDLFITGAWSALPPLAAAIREEFRALAGGDHVTLSAGIAIEQPKYPLYQLAADAGRALEDGAKEFRREKNAICFLQQPVGWKQFKRADNWHEVLREMLADKRQRMPRAILSRLGEIHAIYEENARRQQRRRRTGQITMDEMKEERHFAKWQWRLVYHLERFGRRHPGHREKIEEFQHEITGEDGRLISLLRVIARWTELQTRESNL